MLTDLKHMLSVNPLFPAYVAARGPRIARPAMSPGHDRRQPNGRPSPGAD